MFVRYYLELPLAAAQVEQTLVGAAPGWLASLSTAAQERAEGLAARVGSGVRPKDGAVPEARARPGDRVGPGIEPGVAREVRSGRRVAWSSARRSTCPP
jgi:hypothetical protein